MKVSPPLLGTAYLGQYLCPYCKRVLVRGNLSLNEIWDCPECGLAWWLMLRPGPGRETWKCIVGVPTRLQMLRGVFSQNLI